MLNLIKKYQSKFRILEKWKIDYDPNCEYKSQCSLNRKRKQAVIYEFKIIDKDDDLENYIFHEMLHISFCELGNRHHYKNYLEFREKEEILVQDITKIIEEERQKTLTKKGETLCM